MFGQNLRPYKRVIAFERQSNRNILPCCPDDIVKSGTTILLFSLTLRCKWGSGNSRRLQSLPSSNKGSNEKNPKKGSISDYSSSYEQQ
jgi:hypothetical protein